jgi:hypothetical protein
VPLAAKLEIDAKVIDAVDAVVEAISRIPATSVALVIDHSDTVPETIDQLGGPIGVVAPKLGRRSSLLPGSRDYDHVSCIYAIRLAGNGVTLPAPERQEVTLAIPVAAYDPRMRHSVRVHIDRDMMTG